MKLRLVFAVALLFGGITFMNGQSGSCCTDPDRTCCKHASGTPMPKCCKPKNHAKTCRNVNYTR
jgi:hypothetical protein